jgi:sigma-B regulation protein RsbU (phosphoserine phosphatase)
MSFQSVQSRLLFWIAGTTGVLFASAVLYSFLTARAIVLDDASKLALATAEAHASRIEEVLRSVEEGTRLLGSTLEHTTVSPDELEQVIRAFVAGNPKVFGSAAAVAPQFRGAYAPYFYRRGGEIARADLATETYQYTEQDWYRAAAAGKPAWSEPYFDEGGGNVWMVTYSVPVLAGGKLRGVVTADVSVDWLREIIESDFDGSAYAVVLSRDGQILAHPAAEQAVQEIRTTGVDPRVAEIVAKMLEGEQGFEPFDDAYLGRPARAAFRPVGGAGWSFAVVYPEDELLEEVHALARDEIGILGAGLLALVVVVAALSRRLTRPLRELAASASRIATGDLDLALPPIESKDEVGALTGAFHDMRDSLKQYIQNLEVTTKAKERLESELAIARKIQMDMLPPGRAGGGASDGFELGATLVPARHVGGDLYDHFLEDGKLTFLVGDVSGKGVGAALFMARAKSTLQAAAARGSDLGKVLSAVNRSLCSENEQGMFVTLFAGVLTLASGELEYASAGHDPPVFLPGAGGAPHPLEVDGGPVLGLLDVASYQAERTRLETGDALVLTTDGVSEALDVDGNFFTAEKLLQELSRSPRDPVGAIVDRVLATVKSFAGSAPQSDDITVMAVRYRTRK